MRVFISAAETSSDTHAAELLKRLRGLHLARGDGSSLEVYGVGGPRLRENGLEAIVPAEDLLAMGFAEVVSRLGRIKRALASLEDAVKTRRPDVAILCDYPEFHFKLAARFKRLGIPVICFIPPKVWVWRKSRLNRMKELYARVLSILPFEEKTYAGSGVPFQYVGNPLVDELPLTFSRQEARHKLGLSEEDPVLLLMVGSRPSELRYHLQPMLEAAAVIARQRRPRELVVLVPLPETVNGADFESYITSLPISKEFRIRISTGDAWICMKAADAGIIKSGTSSLEAAILDCPHVVVYRAHPVSEWIYRHVIRYRGAISLTNLILTDGVISSSSVVTELILENFRPDKMAAAVNRVFSPGSGRIEMLGAFARVRIRLQGDTPGDSPSEKAAESVYTIALENRTAT